jgi:hypothetical protein
MESISGNKKENREIYRVDNSNLTHKKIEPLLDIQPPQPQGNRNKPISLNYIN